MAKSADEAEFLKSIHQYFKGAFAWKPPDAGGKFTDMRFQLPRPGDFIFQWLSETGPVGALIELKRFAKGTMRLEDLRKPQELSLRIFARNGGVALVGFHQTNTDDHLMRLIPFETLDAQKTVKVSEFVGCQRIKLGPKQGNGWDLTPLAEIFAAHNVRFCRGIKPVIQHGDLEA